MSRRLALGFALVVSTACGDSSDTTPDAAPDAPVAIDEVAGDINLVYQTYSGAPTAQAAAQFFQSLVFPPGSAPYPYPHADLSVDGCAAAITGFPETQRVSLDVGASVSLVTAGLTITLDRFTVDTDTFYQPLEQLRALTTGVDYDITFPGAGAVAGRTWPAALHMPDPIALTAPAIDNNTITATTGQPVSLAWTPLGVDEVTLMFFGTTSVEPLFRCRVADDGAFDIPAATVDLLPASGLLVISSFNAATSDLDGRPVIAKGQSDVFIQLNHP